MSRPAPRADVEEPLRHGCELAIQAMGGCCVKVDLSRQLGHSTLISLVLFPRYGESETEVQDEVSLQASWHGRIAVRGGGRYGAESGG